MEKVFVETKAEELLTMQAHSEVYALMPSVRGHKHQDDVVTQLKILMKSDLVKMLDFTTHDEAEAAVDWVLGCKPGNEVVTTGAQASAYEKHLLGLLVFLFRL